MPKIMIRLIHSFIFIDFNIFTMYHEFSKLNVTGDLHYLLYIILIILPPFVIDGNSLRQQSYFVAIITLILLSKQSGPLTVTCSKSAEMA